MEKENITVKEKKKLSIKDIGPSKLVMLLLAGILIVLSFDNILPTDNKPKKSSVKQSNVVTNNTTTAKTGEDTDEYINALEERFKKILTKVEGIGNVEVMITLKGSKELVVLKDEPYTQESMNEVDGEGGNRVSSSVDKKEDTVLVNENGENKPYVIKEIEPEVEGIVVIAEGGGNAVVKDEIFETAQVLFNVPAHKVKVMKMNN